MTAQTAAPDPSSRSQEFAPVQGGGDSTSAGALLVVAYLVMWALLLGFLGLGWRRQGKLETRLSELERSVAGKAPGA
ncbi:MAG TPA: CcmD family protein [Polyangiaceae bacterium]|nr:CcmD family protein [Polyangiaceae bacterium]